MGDPTTGRATGLTARELKKRAFYAQFWKDVQARQQQQGTDQGKTCPSSSRNSRDDWCQWKDDKNRAPNSPVPGYDCEEGVKTRGQTTKGVDPLPTILPPV